MSGESPLSALIDAMAKRAAQDYLTAQAALQQAKQPERTKRVPLPASNKAA